MLIFVTIGHQGHDKRILLPGFNLFPLTPREYR